MAIAWFVEVASGGAVATSGPFRASARSRPHHADRSSRRPPGAAIQDRLDLAVSRYYHRTMAKEKVTLTLDSATLQELRALVGARRLSASVEQAIEAYVQHKRHLGAVDEWLAELEREHGPIPLETLEWAARLVDQWDASRGGRRRKRAS